MAAPPDRGVPAQQLQPLLSEQRSEDTREKGQALLSGISARYLFAALSLLRLGVYFGVLAHYCSVGSCEDPPTLSDCQARNGERRGGFYRFVVCLLVCIVHAQLHWSVLNCAYGELLEKPPFPRLYVVLLASCCLLDIAQVCTAGIDHHWIVAHLFFLSLCASWLCFFHGVFQSRRDDPPGDREGCLFVTLFSDPVLLGFLVYILVLCLGAYLAVSFQLDWSWRTWVTVEWSLLVLVCLMELCVAAYLPGNLRVTFHSSLQLRLLSSSPAAEKDTESAGGNPQQA